MRKVPGLSRAAISVLTLACAGALLGARAPLEEEIFFPRPPAEPTATLSGSDALSLSHVLSQLNGASRPACSKLWADEESGAGGKAEVMAKVSAALIKNKSYCVKRQSFESTVCRIARAEAAFRLGRAALRVPDGRTIFSLPERTRVKTIFDRVKKMLLKAIAADEAYSKEERVRLGERVVEIELSEVSYETDLRKIADPAERDLFAAQCRNADGKLMADNVFLSGKKVYICPFHIVMAFSIEPGGSGRPEEVMVLPVAHALAHAAAGLSSPLPGPFARAKSCYEKNFTGLDDTFGLKRPGTFRAGTEKLCCASVASAAPGGVGGEVRNCLASQPEGGCDVSTYLPELAADRLAFSALGTYISAEQEYSIGEFEKKRPGFLINQNRDLFSKNMYLYCDSAFDRREHRPLFDPEMDFARPRRGFRIAEARKNPQISEAVFCPYDTEDLPGGFTKEFGEACWD